MTVTRDDLNNYQRYQMLLKELDDQIENEYNTYRSPQFNRNTDGHRQSSTSPQERALVRIEKFKGKESELEKKIDEIEDYVYSIADPLVMAICIDHYIRGFTWEATCLHLRKHNSTSVVIEMVNKYFKAHDMM